jgi:hypothetical protein
MFNDAAKLHIMSVKIIIKRHLDKHFYPLLGPLSKHYFYLTGGAIASLLQNETPNDWDMYCRSSVPAQATIDRAKDANMIETVDEKYANVMNLDGNLLITMNACTLKNKIQLITRFYGEPRDTRATFDFKHCMPYYDCGEDKLFISEEQYALIKSKKLCLNNPVSWTRHRQEKFEQRGYTLSEHTISAREAMLA